MRLATLQRQEGTVAARLDGHGAVAIERYPSLLELIADGEAGLEAAAAAAGDAVPLADLSLATPLPAPSKIIAIGLNYRSHAEEVSAELPAAPLAFAKLPSALVGHGAAVRWSESVTRRVDYEAELVAVVGRTARNVAAAEALDHIFGYACGNDVSARDLQVADQQWTRAKSLDSFAPVGPWLVSADEVPDPQELQLRCEVSGEVVQDQSTADMIFSVAELIEHLSSWCTLNPGDLIFTGTPAGIGAARKPRRFLGDGDRLAVEISTLGRLENTCAVMAPDPKRSRDGD